MSIELNLDEKSQILNKSPEQRSRYLLTQILETGEVWTLIDKDGAMILTTDDEDCIPIWPDAQFAKEWANGEWAHCKPHSISLRDWQQKWLPGLEDDEIQIVAFPVQGEDGLVLSPWEVADDLTTH